MDNNVKQNEIEQKDNVGDKEIENRNSLDDRLDDIDGGENYPLPTATAVKYIPKPVPPYVPGRGISRYDNAFKNLIPMRPKKKISKQTTAPVDNAGFFSTALFIWMTKYMYKAYSKGLIFDELPEMSPYDSCEYNAQRFELLWKDELMRAGPEKASIIMVAWRFCRTRVLASCFVYLSSLMFGFISVIIFVRKLLEYAESPNIAAGEGIKWALLLTAFELVRIVLFSWSWALNYRTASRLRSACLAVLYRKIIRLNSLGNRSIGELINIFANDGQRIFDSILFGPMIVGGPLITMCGAFYILWLLGPMALLGMATFLLFYPTQYGISRMTVYLRAKTVKVCDMRIRLMNEILDCIKLIKMYAWEKRFSQDLLEIRKNERSLLQKAAYCQSLSISMAPTIPIISSIVTFLAHLSAGGNLTAAQAFPISLFFGNHIKRALMTIREGTQSIVDSVIAFRRLKVFPFTSLLNSQIRNSFNILQIGVANIVDAGISFGRLKTILLMEDGACYVTKPIVKSQAVAISHGTFSCDSHSGQTEGTRSTNDKTKRNVNISKGDEKEMEKLSNLANGMERVEVLFDITFEAPKGKLIGICGHVGSGKSSLLLAALGQLQLVDGQVMRDGSCAYVSQQAWIVNGTLRENILFGQQLEPRRYYKTLFASTLIQDLNMLPGGDETEIGERGVNLSGGQKQRVALARALYANRDIYFLDDPLSAVDAHVGLHIFENLILGALTGKSVLFVTHQIQYLNRCDYIYMMRDGRIVEHGKHDELIELDKEYALMVNTILAETDHSAVTKKEKDDHPPSGEETIVNNISRTVSLSSHVTSEDVVKDKDAGKTLIVAEKVEQGAIKANTYHTYITAAGGYFIGFVVISTVLLNVGSATFSNWWLSTWIKAGGGNSTIITANNTTELSKNLNDNPDFSYYQIIYGASIGLILLTSLFRGLVFTRTTLRASTTLHNSVFMKMINSPMQFFESTPSGRIQNLFSRDMDEVDIRLPITVESIVQNIFTVFFAVLMICFVFPWFMVPLCMLAVIYHFISKIFRVAARDLKRMENSSRSPIFSCVTATVQGLSTIHAFGKESDFQTQFNKMFNENNTCLYLCNVASRWLASRIDVLAVATTGITAFLVIALKGQVPPALAGLALSYSMQLAGVFQYTIRLVSETEVRFISVEKFNYFLKNLKSEGKGTEPTVKPEGNWPTVGEIKFREVQMRYREGSPLVLKNISFTIEAGEKIGIVGRTGSGKSSLTVALFRLVELCGGKIEIDGLDVSEMSLENLRSKLSSIPQDPILFSGTIRSNLDPFKAHTDAEIWEALEKTMLKDRVKELDTSVGFDGDNLSVGEKQLLCLTRALLRHTKILVLDEATAAVDPETEVAVQNTIQKEFFNCTILTIAHRLQTVVSCDRILVMDNGNVLEFDTPTNLLAKHSSEFAKMMAAADKAVKG